MSVPEIVSIGFHGGNIALYLAQLYADPLDVVRELVQNALDKAARHVLIEVDAMCDRSIKCYDDGAGASKSEIMQKFKSIGRSLKTEGDQFGQKGIGNLAGIAIAKCYRLITKDMDSEFDKIRVYELNRDILREQESPDLRIEDWPYAHVVSDKTIKGKVFQVSAMVHLSDVNTLALRRLADLGAIERIIVDAFNKKLFKDEPLIVIAYRDVKGKRTEKEIKPRLFSGIHMESERYDTQHGPLVFDFYFNEKPLENPRILVEHRGTNSFNLANLFKRKQVGEAMAEVFNRGHFEGTIRLGFCTISPARDTFEYDSELEMFVDILTRFTNQVLRPIVERIEEDERKDKFRRVADTIVRIVNRHFQADPGLLPLQFKSFINIRPETELEKKEEKPKVDKTLLRRQRKFSEEEGQTQEPREPQKSGKKSVIRPREGLCLVFVVPDSESSFAWHLRLSPQGMVEVNCVNSDFLKAEMMGLTKLVDYVFMLVAKEFVCGGSEPATAQIFGEHFEKDYMSFWRAILGRQT